jgi:hypothetical protein
MGLEPFYVKGLHLLLLASLQAAHGKITVSGTPNHLNCCVIFIVHTEFKNVATGHLIQPGGPQIRDPWCR